MKDKWTLGICAPVADTKPMESWPDEWWLDIEWCNTELKKHRKCVLVEKHGETCLELDPEGPASCHCPRCNVVQALKDNANIGVRME